MEGRETYITFVAQIDLFGKGFDVMAKDPQPFLFKLHLIHVYVHCGYIFIASCQPRVLHERLKQNQMGFLFIVNNVNTVYTVLDL